MVYEDFPVICIDVKDESPGAVGEDPLQAKEHVKQVDDRKDSGSQSESFSDSKLVSRSIDDELEMQELLAALGEQERESGGGEGADTSNDLEAEDLKGEALTSFHVLDNELTTDQVTENMHSVLQMI